ncbi:MAG: helix-turn-helix domain-containing protein [Solirubrobacteraceae bacterium]
MRTIARRTSRGVRAAMRDGAHVMPERGGAFTPLIDAKAASALLGVPYTWLLAQARERRVPHHRLGHYVRFNPDDLAGWLAETRDGPGEGQRY